MAKMCSKNIMKEVKNQRRVKMDEGWLSFEGLKVVNCKEFLFRSHMGRCSLKGVIQRRFSAIFQICLGTSVASRGSDAPVAKELQVPKMLTFS